ncbi:MAG: hypothetical protein M1485_01310 [Chloroflexi bacterium]|nr:hypothetical protein [Chloroflexota bacterium]
MRETSRPSAASLQENGKPLWVQIEAGERYRFGMIELPAHWPAREVSPRWVALLTPEQRELLEQLSASPEILNDKKQTVETYRCTNKEATDTIPSLIDSLAQ